ncbi:MAG: YraN family protein [Patescibacteria group bacterium]|nr:YraN family protein [Patescibacteria group bacterium]
MGMKGGEIGKLGEEIAVNFLKGKGYSIIERNYLKPYGEIDIIAKKKKGPLVFVEVKTMRLGALSPEDNVTARKTRILRRICTAFANEWDDLVGEGWQIDLVAVTVVDDGEGPKITHYENIG